MNIKYGITQWSLPGNGLYAIKHVAELGLDGMQLELGTYDEGYYMAQKKLQDDYLDDAKKYNIEFPSIVLNDLMKHGFVWPKESDDYKIAMETLERGLAVAEAMGISKIMIPQFWSNEITNEEQFEITAQILRMYCKKAAERGLHIESETTLSAERQTALFAAVGMTNLTVFYDSHNYYYFSGFSQKEILEKLYPYMGDQLHVKDCFGQNGKGGILAGAMLGEGDSDFLGTIEVLKKKNYSGWIILENSYFIKPLRDKNADQYALVKQDLDYVKHALRI